jgi:hypothetical protein
MKRAIFISLVCLLIAACSTETPSTESTSLIAVQSISTPFPTATHVFKVLAWVDDPSPQVGSRVMLFGSLIKDGVHLGGMAMRATWPDETQERGVPNCSVQVIYGSGVCIVETDVFQSGVFVPITVTFEYQGMIYSGKTGIIPR